MHGYFQESEALSNQASDDHVSSLAASGRKDCWLIVHGVAGNFYNSSLLNSISSRLLLTGADVLRMNTRGHDAISYFAVGAGSSRCGAAYEMICDGVLDIAAWVHLLWMEGYRSINLLGHSLGAVKSVLFSSQDTSPGFSEALNGFMLSRLVLLSPPRLNSEILGSDPKYANHYRENLEESQKYCQAGTPERLITVRYPQPMTVSAATYIDKYGPENNYDYHRFVENISCSTLWCFGEYEVRGPRASFRDADDLLKARLETISSHKQSLAILLGADHAYTGVRDLLCDSVIEWTKATVQ